jgi:hypothetical protein
MNPQEPVDITCPYCGEPITLLVDCSAGSQEYIEDCQVCCRPISLQINIDKYGRTDIVARRDSD